MPEIYQTHNQPSAVLLLEQALTNESKSWLLHDLVQAGNLLLMLGGLVTGVLFITEIKEDNAVQSAELESVERRIGVVEKNQEKTDSKLQKAVESLREELGGKVDRLDGKIDKLIDRELNGSGSH